MATRLFRVVIVPLEAGQFIEDVDTRSFASDSAWLTRDAAQDWGEKHLNPLSDHIRWYVREDR